MRLLAAGLIGALIVYEVMCAVEDPGLEEYIKGSFFQRARRRCGHVVAASAWTLAVWVLFT